MGKSNSKPVPQIDLSKNKETIVENSSGFHVVELNIPSVGEGLAFFIIFLVLGFALFWWCRRYRRSRARGRQEATANMLQCINGGAPTSPAAGPFGSALGNASTFMMLRNLLGGAQSSAGQFSGPVITSLP